MYNGKIFPTKLRKMLAIIGSVLLVIIVILSIFNAISYTVSGLSIAVVVVVFAFLLPMLIKQHEQKQGNKQLNPTT